jgi:hypothetical protein
MYKLSARLQIHIVRATRRSANGAADIWRAASAYLNFIRSAVEAEGAATAAEVEDDAMVTFPQSNSALKKRLLKCVSFTSTDPDRPVCPP